MVCARAYLIASSMTLLTCNLFLFSWAKSLQKKGRSCGHETGVPPRRRRRIIQNHKTRKKKCKKNTQTDDEKDEKDETKNFFVIFYLYGIRKGCGFFDVIFGFWFFALYVLVIDDFFLWYLWNTRTTLILLTTTALRSHRSTSGWRGRRFHEGRRQRKSLSALSSPIGTALTGFD